MSFKAERRDLLKLATFFAAAVVIERGYAMDIAPRSQVKSSTSKAPSNKDANNGWAVNGSSNFKAVYGDPQLRAEFFLFLKNVYNIFPEERFHTLIEEVSNVYGNDKEIYRHAQSRLPEIKPFLGAARYALPALGRQKAEMSRQAMLLMGEQRKINGYLEIGTTGRYVGHLESHIELTGDVVLLHSDAPSYSPTDIAERGGLRKIGRFIPLEDYAPVLTADLADGSLDMVANFIGFHHASPDRRDQFVKSLHRALRPGGRMIVRDHDVSSRKMNHMVALAHDVFSMGLGLEWSLNQQEIRNFTSVSELSKYLGKMGFKSDGRTIMQEGDPTKNALMVFTKV